MLIKSSFVVNLLMKSTFSICGSGFILTWTTVVFVNLCFCNCFCQQTCIKPFHWVVPLIGHSRIAKHRGKVIPLASTYPVPGCYAISHTNLKNLHSYKLELDGWSTTATEAHAFPTTSDFYCLCCVFKIHKIGYVQSEEKWLRRSCIVKSSLRRVSLKTTKKEKPYHCFKTKTTPLEETHPTLA